MRSAKKPTAVSAATASITATIKEAQLAGAEVARASGAGELPGRAGQWRRFGVQARRSLSWKRNLHESPQARTRGAIRAEDSGGAERCMQAPRTTAAGAGAVICRMNTLPSVFVSHGSPMIALEPGEAGAFMQRLGPAIDAAFRDAQRAIVAISAHTAARAPVLLAGARHQAVYDFGGFDPRLNQMRYDAPGAPELANDAPSC
jgi:hypothetical protein